MKKASRLSTPHAHRYESSPRETLPMHRAQLLSRLMLREVTCARENRRPVSVRVSVEPGRSICWDQASADGVPKPFMNRLRPVDEMMFCLWAHRKACVLGR
jgi:hypothetical protein